jgi:hypothetical protein
MKSLSQLSPLSGLVLIAAGAVFAPPALAQVENAPSKEFTKSDPLCPTISVSCPSSIEDGKVLSAAVDVSRAAAASIATYDWTIHGGTITEGNGTAKINFKVNSGRDSYTVSVKLGGLDSSCPATASCSLIICKPPPSTKFNSYGSLHIEKEKERLDAFAALMTNQPGLMGYILAYAGRQDVAGASGAVAQRGKAYLVEKGIQADRIVIVEGGVKENLTIDLWIAPPGATPPKPEAAITPRDFDPIKSPV